MKLICEKYEYDQVWERPAQLPSQFLAGFSSWLFSSASPSSAAEGESSDFKGVLTPDMTLYWAEYFCIIFCITVLRWILSRTFKDDVNNDYGIYPENGDNVVMEAVDQNTEYEQPAAGDEDQAIGRQVSENEYDKMYTDEHEYHQNEYDKMY